MRQPLVCLLVAVPLFAASGCASTSEQGSFGAKAATAKTAPTVTDDHSLCDWKGKPDRESSETAGPGSIQPNVRRVYQVLGTGEERHKVLICREIDTNFDGIKDVVRRYNEKGESISEEADSNYDGKIDTWILFVKGRLAEVKVDTNFDGKPDEWKYYSGGKLTRVVRDSNFNGKPDIWEIYRDGHLERMGVDVDGDEHVDRWDHDNEMRHRFEEAERKKEETEAAAKKAHASDSDGSSDQPSDAPKRQPSKRK